MRDVCKDVRDGVIVLLLLIITDTGLVLLAKPLYEKGTISIVGFISLLCLVASTILIIAYGIMRKILLCRKQKEAREKRKQGLRL